MAENSYTGFGSQFVFEPKNLRVSDNDRNVGESTAQWRNLMLQLKYFTIQAHPEGSTSNVNTDHLNHDVSGNNSADEANFIIDESVLVVENNSCESFHSCHSSISYQDLLKCTQDRRKIKNRQEYVINKTCEDKFLDQITMINAIFLDKKTYENVSNENNKYKPGSKDLLNKTYPRYPTSFINVKNSSFKHDQSSGDRSSKKDCKAYKHSSLQNVANILTPNNGKEVYQEQCVSGRTKLFDEKHTNNPEFKIFKISRKTTPGTKKPLISKLISRRRVPKFKALKKCEIKCSDGSAQCPRTLHFPQTDEIKCSDGSAQCPRTLHFPQSDEIKCTDGRAQCPRILHFPQIDEIKCSDGSAQCPRTLHFPRVDDELHTSRLILLKHGINEGYEMHLFEPIQSTNLSVTLYSENAEKKSKIDILSLKGEEKSQNKECKIIKCYNDFEESLLKLSNKQQNSDTNPQLPGEIKESKINIEFVNGSSQSEINQSSNFNSDLKLNLTKDQGSFSGKSHEQGDFTVLYKSESKNSDLSLNETFFETLFKSEDCTEKVNSKHKKEETIEGYKIEKKSDELRISKSRIKNKTGQDVENKNSAKTINQNCTSFTNHRSSSSRKNTLPVIEETVEESSLADVLDNDYCLVDTLGRPIHLFDHRGLPLTDGSGRPLRSAAGELLMKCDNNGIPVVEESQIFDMSGRQPHEEDFQPWMSPQIEGASSRLTTGDGRPLVLFDLEGRPLTSISGTMLVDSSGRGLLKLRNCFIQSTLRD